VRVLVIVAAEEERRDQVDEQTQHGDDERLV
jgi:hypothetical protein